jgi:outer membrane protein TolC
MAAVRRSSRWRLARRLGGLILPCWLPLTGLAGEPERLAAPQPATVVAVAPAPVYTLDECRRIALERQPAVVAQRATLAAAETQKRAVDALLVPDLVRPELPIRRKQACLGVSIAAAGVQQAEWDAGYAVTRTYLSVLYAREQLKVAGEVVENLQLTRDSVSEAVKAGTGSKEWTQNTVDKIASYLGLAQVRQAEARRGVDLALAALREAMGVGPEHCFDVGFGLPGAGSGVPCKEQLFALALSRRGELAQAATLAEVTRLESAAQGRLLGPLTQTFAAASDVHARPIPAGEANGEYRPGALAPEMPTHLVGPKNLRVERACDLARRADAVAEKTRNLIALEVEDYFLKYRTATEQIAQTRAAAEAARRLAKSTRGDLAARVRVGIEDVLTNEVLSGQVRAAFNEAVYEQALALAGLERATAGGVPFVTAPAQQPAEPANSNP